MKRAMADTRLHTDIHAKSDPMPMPVPTIDSMPPESSSTGQIGQSSRQPQQLVAVNGMYKSTEGIFMSPVISPART